MADASRQIGRVVSDLYGIGADTERNAVNLLMGDLLTALDEGHVGLSIGKMEKPEYGIEFLRSKGIAGKPDSDSPLIIDRGLVYFRKYYEMENRCAKAIAKMSFSEPAAPFFFDEAKRIVGELLPDGNPDDDGVIQARAAMQTAIMKRFTVITGGPGTGKTYALTRIISAMARLYPRSELTIAAPTGKAAYRINESIARAVETLPAACRESFPELTAVTVHRLLGKTGDPVRDFEPKREGNQNHGIERIILIDECSMLDIAQLDDLFMLLGDTGRLVLLGDSNQLASVEAGSVFADICSLGGDNSFSHSFSESYAALFDARLPVRYLAGGNAFPLTDSVVTLTVGRRFKSDSGIGKLSESVKKGDSQTAMSILSAETDDLRLVGAESFYAGSEKTVENPAFIAVAENLGHLVRSANPGEALRLASGMTVLTPYRKGKGGVERLNALLLALSLGRQKNETVPGRTGSAPLALWSGDISEAFAPPPARMPIVITRNNYDLQLFNGDTGILFRTEEESVHAYFPSLAGQTAMPRKYPVTMLPPWEPAFAITVHKSQGSEYGVVVMVLPETDAPFLTRELLYTGITRSRGKLYIAGSADIIAAAIEKTIVRESGLPGRIRDYASILRQNA